MISLNKRQAINLHLIDLFEKPILNFLSDITCHHELGWTGANKSMMRIGIEILDFKKHHVSRHIRSQCKDIKDNIKMGSAFYFGQCEINSLMSRR